MNKLDIITSLFIIYVPTSASVTWYLLTCFSFL